MCCVFKGLILHMYKYRNNVCKSWAPVLVRLLGGGPKVGAPLVAMDPSASPGRIAEVPAAARPRVEG